jgi:hypothetical protein
MYQKDFNKLLNGEFVNSYCNFYDWFCKDSSLEKKALSLSKKAKFLVDEGILNPETTYVRFMNNYPCYGSLYDDMGFCTKEESDNDYLGGIAPSLGYTNLKGKCNVFLASEDFKDILFDTWPDFKKEVKTNPEFKARLKTALWVS